MRQLLNSRIQGLLCLFLCMLPLLAPGLLSAAESRSITSSAQPGELWLRHYESSNSLDTESSIRHSSDYGRTWEIVYGNTGQELDYHRDLGVLALGVRGNLLLTADNFETDTLWADRSFIETEWLPDTLAWAAFKYSYGHSFDSLQTFDWPRFGGFGGANHFFILPRLNALGWSPGDFSAYGTVDDVPAFAFSTDFADTFQIRSVGELDVQDMYACHLFRGVASGEMYLVDISGRNHSFSVSMDTMATWSAWQPLPESHAYLGCDVEIERGWFPGEWYYLVYDEWAYTPEIPRVGLYHTADFGQTWNLVYSTIEDVFAAETPSVTEILPITVHPNPGNGLFEIHSTSSLSNISLFNSLGQLVMSLPVQPDKRVWALNLTCHATGTYYLNWKDHLNNRATTKIHLIK